MRLAQEPEEHRRGVQKDGAFSVKSARLPVRLFLFAEYCLREFPATDALRS